MIACTSEKDRVSWPYLLETRLFLNEIIRLLLDSPPEKIVFQKIVTNPSFQSLSKIDESFRVISNAIHTLLLDPVRLQQTKTEYNRLFIGPNALPAPLWESVYLGREHVMFEEQTLQVRQCYRKHGLVFTRENNEPEDHLVIELEFLSYLMQQTHISMDDQYTEILLKDQSSFVNDHLAKWGPTFCELLGNSTEFLLYQALSQLLNNYIELEQAIANMLKESIENE